MSHTRRILIISYYNIIYYNMENYYDYGPDFQMLTSARTYPDSYTQEIINNIQLLSLRPEEAVPFGSYIYKIQKYPGDIDLTETFEDCCTIDEVVNKVAKKLQRIVKDIVSLKTHYMTEAKFGEDDRYNPGAGIMGFIDKGIYYFNDKNKNNLETYAGKLLKRNLISKKEYKTIIIIAEKDNKNTYDYDILSNIFREHRILRWTDEEVIKGYKMIPENIKVKLVDALKQKAHVKIDMIVKINNKFIEMTNFYFLVADHVDGNKYVINFGENLTEKFIKDRVEKGLPEEIEKLFYSKYYWNPFKGVKRLWALARHYKDERMINKLKSFISGNISLLYQLKSEIGNIIMLIKKLKTYPKVSINNQIQDIKSRLVYVLEVGEDELTLDKWFNNATIEDNKYEKIKLLEKIEAYMKDAINYFTMEKLNHIGIDYLSYPYIPKDPHYNTQHMITENIQSRFDEDEEYIRNLQKEIEDEELNKDITEDTEFKELKKKQKNLSKE